MRTNTFKHLKALCDTKGIVCENGRYIDLTTPDGGTTANCESLREAFEVYRDDPTFAGLPIRMRSARPKRAYSEVDGNEAYVVHHDGCDRICTAVGMTLPVRRQTAQRIAACWNACAGMTDPVAEVADLKLKAADRNEWQDACANVAVQRDAAYKALRGLLNAYCPKLIEHIESKQFDSVARTFLQSDIRRAVDIIYPPT